ncbi:D-allulose 6-phosphate 3-epimerase [Planomicrobium sp. CPCC 101110]|uniref:D-allulose 6-phosphate 3-epimerase n=1 Tax=Planomicrobium sp. CPCC 101110 TaxID=2599619 RepID=UPI0011B7879E|nr:D-allulose 6-phosphate 3-epimerase [Planomicrobium sp. CPCC 101110]TWT25411.1 ribulose-phosphate 3-epimerase [Planomicrobium sp. CPCC 101110]
MKPMFSASLMCMDFLHIKDQIEILNENIEYYHIDIIDGHYSKNFSLSPDLMKAFKKVATKPMDVHLATTNPDDWIEMCAKAGAEYITVHAETINKDAFRILNMIKAAGCKVGIAVNPATPLNHVEYYLNRAELLTIMTVDPGFPGQPFIPEMLQKIKEAKRIREEKGYNYSIQVDGSVNEKTFNQLHEAGADIYVLGSSGLFGIHEDLKTACEKAYKNFEHAITENVAK